MRTNSARARGRLNQCAAWAAVTKLTEAERSLLYSIRSFAQFRKQFTFQVATLNYLGLLSQEQGELDLVCLSGRGDKDLAEVLSSAPGGPTAPATDKL